MTLDQLDHWLDEYGRAWERQDVEAFVGCFTADAVYHWGPFGEPLRGTDEIRRRTQAAVAGQSEIAFRHEPLAVTPDGRGICIWGVTYIDTQSGKRLEDEGVFLVTFDAHGRCSEFREWWNARELDL